MELESPLPCSQEPFIYQNFELHAVYIVKCILRSILILSFLFLGLPSYFFSSGLPTHILLAFFISYMRAICTAYLLGCFPNHTNTQPVLHTTELPIFFPGHYKSPQLSCYVVSQNKFVFPLMRGTTFQTRIKQQIKLFSLF